jgi:hypothetical protein
MIFRMDRALWLLLRLRLRGWLRRLRRALSTVRGILLCAFGVLLFATWIGPAVLLGPAPPEHLHDVRRFGPLVLVAFCVLNVVLSPGERGIVFSPAEVNLLFPGPFSRRQLLLYKIAGGFGTALISALFVALLTRQHTASLVAGFVGLALIFLFGQLFSMTLALLASAVGARAYNRSRRLVLAAVLAGLAAVAILQGAEARQRGWLEVLQDVEQQPVVQAILTPVGWLIQASTAARVWPDLVQWAGLGLLLNAALLLVVLALDAHYLEAAAAASEKLYARLQQLRRGAPAGGLPSGSKARLGLPSLPRWGGVGPVAWRQLTTALRSLGSLVLLLVIFGTVMVPALLSPGRRAGTDSPVAFAAAMLVGMSLFVPALLPFDFRGDLDRMDLLKTLPLPTWRLVVGQLLAPVLVVCLAQLLMLAGAQAVGGGAEPIAWVTAAFLGPVNFLLFGVENLFFLLLPTRLTGLGPGDFQVLGRQMLLWLAKLLVLGVALALAGLAGLAAWLLTESLLVVGVTLWVVVAGEAVSLLPLLVLAFDHFDVARDLP